MAFNKKTKFKSESKSRTPSDLTITARHVDFDYQAAMTEKQYWHGNDPVVTHFFNALQATFPEGERFFIDSARDARDEFGEQNLSPELLGQIKQFIRQEALHGKQHDAWNQALINLGYTKMADFDQELRQLRLWSRSKVSANARLSMTAASEHFTASIAHMFLNKRPDLLENAAQPFQTLLIYHALEEVEHKAVCYDLYNEVSGHYGLRMLGLLTSTLDIMYRVAERQIYLLKKDGLWNFKTAVQSWRLIWGKKGIAIQLFPYVMNYLRPSFHPWESDERPRLKQKYGDLLEQAGLSV